MTSELTKNLFLVKQNIGMFKAANSFDIYDPLTSNLELVCREENLGFFTKFLRFTNFKVFTPFSVSIRSKNGNQIIYLKRNASLGFSPIVIFDEKNMPIGKLKPKIRIGGAKIEIQDMSNTVLATLTGNLIGWDFKVKENNLEIAIISKKWAGIGKELFTSADNYILKIDDSVPDNSNLRPLILSSVLCIDFLLKNK